MKFVGQGRCEDVLTYPLHVASVYPSCSSVPDFAVSLPSVHGSLHTTLRLANWLHQLASKRLPLSGIFSSFRYLHPCWAHTSTIIHKFTELFAKASGMGYFYRYLKSPAYG